MIFTVSNKESDIKNLLIKLRSDYGDYAFISYIDGEYGIRVWAYNSLVYEFYKLMKNENKVCIGIVFKNTKCFLNNLCDHIIEIDDVEFYSNSLNTEYVDNSGPSFNHINNIVPSNSYVGNDGWDLVYIRGIHSKVYEDILLEMKFSNIFYTLHVDGSRYINLHGCNNGYIYKVNNTNVVINNIDNKVCINKINLIQNFDKRNNTNKTNNIVIWARNSNKWPGKNINKDNYETLFNYCIKNNKKCYVFQDLIPIEMPNHTNIIDCTKREKNRPDYDNFIKVCSDSDIFIGADSGPYYLLIHHSIPIMKMIYGNVQYSDNNTISNIFDITMLINSIQNFYS